MHRNKRLKVSQELVTQDILDGRKKMTTTPKQQPSVNITINCGELSISIDVKRIITTTQTTDYDEECCICLDKTAQVTTMPCAHKVVCASCFDHHTAEQHRIGAVPQCVICRQNIEYTM